MTGAVAKAELHCHIEGTVSAALALSQAGKYGVDTSAFISGDRYVWSDFASFLFAYDNAARLFRTEEDYALLAESYIDELAAYGTILSEIFVSPDHARAAGLSPEAYVAGLGEGLMRAGRRNAIVCRMIVVGVRHEGADAVEAAARFAASRPHPLVAGFGMAGDERYGKAADHARAFAMARDAGLGTTVHAGELAGAESVRDTLDHLTPDRIGHGVRAIEDPALVERLAEGGTVLEVCPGSNIALGIFENFERHPFPELARAGVKLTLNSDDPPFFATSLAREYEIAAEYFGLGNAGLRDVTKTAIEAAFIDDSARAGLLARL